MQPYNPDHDAMVSQTEDDKRAELLAQSVSIIFDIRTSRYTREMNKPIQSTWFERVNKYLDQLANESEQEWQNQFALEWENDMREQELAEQYNQLAREWHEKGWM